MMPKFIVLGCSLMSGAMAYAVFSPELPPPSDGVAAAEMVFSGALAPLKSEQVVGDVQLQSDALSPPAIFSVSNFRLRTVCVVERAGAFASGRRYFSAPEECDRVWPDLSHAIFWNERQDGRIELSDAVGRVVLTLVRSDHFTYEAAKPKGSDLAMLMMP